MGVDKVANELNYKLKEYAAVLKEKGVDARDIAKKLGYSEGLVSKYVKLKQRVSEKFWNKFIAEYGSQVLDKSLPIEKHEKGTIPFIDKYPAANSYNVSHEHTDAVPNIRVKIPGFEDCNFATNVFGHSMYPTFESGSIIICKVIEDLQIIAYGECYLIETKEQWLVKRVIKHPANPKAFILAVSDNKENNYEGMAKYAPIEIPRNKIKNLFLIKGTVKRTQI